MSNSPLISFFCHQRCCRQLKKNREAVDGKGMAIFKEKCIECRGPAHCKRLTKLALHISNGDVLETMTK